MRSPSISTHPPVGGSFVLGLITGLVMRHNAPVAVLTIAGTGFCSSYATFQHTAIFETLTLVRRHRYLAATTHAGGTLVGLTGADQLVRGIKCEPWGL